MFDNRLLAHAYPMEVLQLVVALTGFLYNVVGLLEARTDARIFLQYGTRPQKRVVAAGHVRRETLNLACTFFLVIIGVVSSSLAPPPPVVEPDVRLSIDIIRVLLCIISMLLLAKSVYAQRERFILKRMWLDDDRRKALPDEQSPRRRKEDQADHEERYGSDHD